MRKRLREEPGIGEYQLSEMGRAALHLPWPSRSRLGKRPAEIFRGASGSFDRHWLPAADANALKCQLIRVHRMIPSYEWPRRKFILYCRERYYTLDGTQYRIAVASY